MPKLFDTVAYTYEFENSNFHGATRNSPVSIGKPCPIAGDVVFLAHVGRPVYLLSTFNFHIFIFHNSRTYEDDSFWDFDSTTNGPSRSGTMR